MNEKSFKYSFSLIVKVVSFPPIKEIALFFFVICAILFKIVVVFCSFIPMFP